MEPSDGDHLINVWKPHDTEQVADIETSDLSTRICGLWDFCKWETILLKKEK